MWSNWCDYKFEGEIKYGERVKIVGAVRPTIGSYVPGEDITIEKLGDKPLPDYYSPDAFRKLFEYEFAFGRKLSSSPDLDYINRMGLRGATDCCIRCFTDESWKSMLDLLNE